MIVEVFGKPVKLVLVRRRWTVWAWCECSNIASRWVPLHHTDDLVDAQAQALAVGGVVLPWGEPPEPFSEVPGSPTPTMRVYVPPLPLEEVDDEQR